MNAMRIAVQPRPLRFFAGTERLEQALRLAAPLVVRRTLKFVLAIVRGHLWQAVVDFRDQLFDIVAEFERFGAADTHAKSIAGKAFGRAETHHIT